MGDVQLRSFGGGGSRLIFFGAGEVRIGSGRVGG
jgi:hypothetical protein